MQCAKTYISGIFKREARYQFEHDFKKMKKKGWHVHTVTDEGVGTGTAHTGRLTVIDEKEIGSSQTLKSAGRSVASQKRNTRATRVVLKICQCKE